MRDLVAKSPSGPSLLPWNVVYLSFEGRDEMGEVTQRCVQSLDGLRHHAHPYQSAHLLAIEKLQIHLQWIHEASAEDEEEKGPDGGQVGCFDPIPYSAYSISGDQLLTCSESVHFLMHVPCRYMAMTEVVVVRKIRRAMVRRHCRMDGLLSDHLDTFAVADANQICLHQIVSTDKRTVSGGHDLAAPSHGRRRWVMVDQCGVLLVVIGAVDVEIQVPSETDD
jgi:hypothetical protein